MAITANTYYEMPTIQQVWGTVSQGGVAGASPGPRAISISSPTTSRYIPLQWGSEFAGLFAKLHTLEDHVGLTDVPAPDREAIELARIVLTRFHQIGAIPDKLVATAEGGVAICFVDGDKYSDIECLNGGKVLGVTTDRRGRPTVWEIEQIPLGIDHACSRIQTFIGRRS